MYQNLSKYKEKIIQIKRVTKVVKGGKTLSFRALVIVGNQNSKVGFGISKSSDVNSAIEKALLKAKKNLINIPITSTFSIPESIKAQYGASSILLKPAKLGTGVIAGGCVRAVLELAGIRNIATKQFGARNYLNNTKATLLALEHLSLKFESFSSVLNKNNKNES